MTIVQAFFEAVESLAGNKLRSGLTILGIVIGVGAVIAMLAIGRGAEASITGSIQGIGTNLMFVFRGGQDVRNPAPLTLGDANALAEPFAAPNVVAVAPLLQGSAEVTFGGESTTTQLQGVTPVYSTMRNYNVSEGEFINEGHIIGRSSVALIGPETADELFGRSEALVGETIRIEGQPFRVIGILEAKGGGGFGPSEDDQVMIPLSTAQARLLRRSTADRVDAIMVQAASAEAVPLAREEISQILRTRHRTDVGLDDFTVTTQQEFLDIFSSITGVLTVFLGGIAGISLLVGGIGIMNIMLVSVTERTREIGLRKALGARRSDILVQFLTESSVLSLIGGIIGIGLGWGISAIVSQIAVASGTEFFPVIGVDAVLLATIFSAAVGLFFGIYPANRAANLEPVEALRYE